MTPDEIAQEMIRQGRAAGMNDQQIQAMIDQSGTHFDLKPWDWQLYSQKVRKARYFYDNTHLAGSLTGIAS